MSIEEKTIGAILTELIAKSGLSAREVALKAGVPIPSVHTILRRDSTRVDIRTLKKLANVFGEDLEIFCGDLNYKKKLDISGEEEQLITTLRTSGPELMVMVKELVKKPPRPLSKTEQKIVDLLAQLNETGTERLLETTEDMVMGGRYAK